jgi:signal transduction histidine kinase
MINVIPKTNGARNGALGGDVGAGAKSSVMTRQGNGEIQPDFLGKNLENIIAGVAVERKRAGKALRLLTGKLIHAQEEERRRLARELHDGLSQQLAMLTVELGMVVKQMPENTPSLREQLSRLRDRSERIADDLRRMMHQLHPAALEHLGLVSALRSHCCEVSTEDGIKVQFRVLSELGQVPPEVAVCLYRIAQEALRNVSKHSGAREAWVEIDHKGDGILLSIADKGIGFDDAAPKGDKSLGLISMRERVRILDGTIKIKSAPGEGTRVNVRVPLEVSRPIRLPRRNHAKTKALAG